MENAVNATELAKLIRRRRQSRALTIRSAATEADVSPATLWRAEKGEPPTDIRVINRLCHWLGIPASRVMTSVNSVESHNNNRIQHGTGESTAEMIEAHLRADRDLDPETAAALGDAFRRLYELSVRTPERKEPS